MRLWQKVSLICSMILIITVTACSAIQLSYTREKMLELTYEQAAEKQRRLTASFIEMTDYYSAEGDTGAVKHALEVYCFSRFADAESVLIIDGETVWSQALIRPEAYLELSPGSSQQQFTGEIDGRKMLIIGSGKTVLMKCICGFMLTDEGEITANGFRVGKEVDFPPELGLIIETPGFLPKLTGLENLELLALLTGKTGREGIEAAIRRVGLDPCMKKPVGKYSLGMRQRLGIAQAIMEEPKLLILDEPFNGLDKKGAEQMRKLLKELRAEGKTILLSSHNQRDIDELCDTVCEMDAGILRVM